MNELVPNEYVTVEEDVIKTTSRIVAKKFDKAHKNVLRNINILMQHVDITNFEPINYLDSQGRNQVEYEMDKKGFMLLAMRFTGTEALKVQIAFVDAFEAMEKYIKNGIKEVVVHKAETVIGEFKAYTEAAKLFGLNDNQAVLCSNKTVKRLYGIDIHANLQIEMKSPVQERMFNPTDLGKIIGLSSQSMNKKLEANGMQTKVGEVWAPSEKAKVFCVLLDTNKKHSDGTPIQQLKWYESVLKELTP